MKQNTLYNFIRQQWLDKDSPPFSLKDYQLKQAQNIKQADYCLITQNIDTSYQIEAEGEKYRLVSRR